MILFENKCFIPIGCSCINQFQLDFYFGIKKPTFSRKLAKLFSKIAIFSRSKSAQKKAGLFDWIITSPNSTIQIFEAIQANNVYTLFMDKSNYSVECGHLKNNAFDNLYFWHEDGENILRDNSQFQKFQSKVTHLIDNMLYVAKLGGCILLWSNIQPNLRSAMMFRPNGWDSFILRQEQYVRIITLTKSIFGEGSRCAFICRAEDVDFPCSELNDIIVIEVDRGNEFRGEEGLYAPVFNNMIQ